jgi:hypothetical protein
MEFLHFGFSVQLPRSLGYIPITNELEKRFLGREGRYASTSDPGVANEFLETCLNFRSSYFHYDESIDGFINMMTDRFKANYDGMLGLLMVDTNLIIYSLAASLILTGDINSAIFDLQILFDKNILDQSIDKSTRFYTLDPRGGDNELRPIINIAQDKSSTDPVMEDAAELYKLLGNSVDAAVRWLRDIEYKNKDYFRAC